MVKSISIVLLREKTTSQLQISELIPLKSLPMSMWSLCCMGFFIRHSSIHVEQTITKWNESRMSANCYTYWVYVKTGGDTSLPRPSLMGGAWIQTASASKEPRLPFSFSLSLPSTVPYIRIYLYAKSESFSESFFSFRTHTRAIHSYNKPSLALDPV